MGNLDGDSVQKRADLLDYLKEMLEPGVSPRSYQDARGRRSDFTVETCCNPESTPRTLFGRIRVGTDGQRMDVDDASGNRVEVRQPDMVSRLLFYWCTLPTNARSGLLLTERVGNFGIRSAFWDQVRTEVSDMHEGLSLRISHYYPETVWREYLRDGDGMQGATLLRVLRDEDETRDLDRPSRIDDYGTLKLDVRRRLSKSTIIRLLRGDDPLGNTAVDLLLPPVASREKLEDIGFDTVLLDLTIDGEKRRVRLGRDSQPRVGYPCDDVDLDDDEYPEQAAMAAFAADLERTLADPLGW